MKTTTALAGAFLVSIGSVSALAATHPDLEAIGFSADGRYFAYTESRLPDRSGFEACSLVVLNVERSQVLATFEETSEPTPMAARACERAAAAAAPTLRGLGLASPWAGAPVGMRLSQPVGTPNGRAGRLTMAELALADPARACIATLTERGQSFGAADPSLDLAPLRWRLTVSCEGVGKVLETGGTALGCELVSAFAHRDGLVVVLSESQRGSDGSADRTLVVSGRMRRGTRYEVEPIGFDAEGNRFAWWRSGVDESGAGCAELHAAEADVDTPLVQLRQCENADAGDVLARFKARAASVVADLGVAADRGEEVYRGPGASWVSLLVSGVGLVRLRLEPEGTAGNARVAFILTMPDGSEKKVWAHQGSHFSFKSVLLARGSPTLAVVVRYARPQDGAEQRSLATVLVPLRRR